MSTPRTALSLSIHDAHNQPIVRDTPQRREQLQNLARRSHARSSPLEATPPKSTAPRPRTKTTSAAGLAARSPPLITAALDGDYAAVERCLLRGDRTDARDADGKRAADIAAERGHTEIAALIAAWQAAPGLSEQTRREVTDARREAAREAAATRLLESGKIDVCASCGAFSVGEHDSDGALYCFSCWQAYEREQAEAQAAAAAVEAEAEAAAAAVAMQVEAQAAAAAALAKAAERQREVELLRAAKRWSSKFLLGRTFSAWLAALATARSSARDEARARGLLVPLEHAGLSDRLAAAVGFARAEGVAAAAEISAHGLVSAFVAALAPIGRVHESKVRDELRRAAAGGADDEIVRLAREEALRLGVLLPLQRAGLDENLEALSAALLFLQAEGAAASDVTPCGLEDDLLNAIAAAAGTLGRASQQRLRAELRDAAAAAAPAVADVGSRSPRRFW